MAVDVGNNCSQAQIKDDAGVSDLAWCLMDSLAAPLVAVNMDQKIFYLNQAAEGFLGHTFAGVVGKHWGEVIRLFHEDQPVDAVTQDDSVLPESLPKHGLWYLMQHDDGRMIPVRLSIAYTRRSPDVNPSGMSIVIHEVGAIKRAVDQLNHQSTHDGLTGIVNRREIEKRIERLLNKSKQSGQAHALLFLDLDGFKLINDAYGHQAGDEVLRQVVKLFNSIVRERDTVARYGRDEFMLLLEHCSMQDAVAAARMLRATLREYALNWQGREIEIDVSIGVVAVDYRYGDLASVITKADEACYRAKRSCRTKIFTVPPAGDL